MSSDIGLVGLAVMGQNLALNIASKGFKISVFNRSPDKVDTTLEQAEKDGLKDKVFGHKDMKEFVSSLSVPRKVIILVKAGAPVDETISQLSLHLSPGDLIIDGGNEWYLNTERRGRAASERGLLYLGMGVSGGEEGARNGPSLMPGGPKQAFDLVWPILKLIAANVDGPCAAYIGPGGAGNYVKMLHNGIEYGDMQLISEAYDVLKHLGGFSNEELHKAFDEWNKGELESFLIEITAQIFAKKDDLGGSGHLVDYVVDKTGMKGTGKWTVQEAAEKLVAAPTIASALDGRYLSGLKDQRVAASEILRGDDPNYVLNGKPVSLSPEEKKALVDDVRQALYASKICSYAQGMNVIREAGEANQWNLDLATIARIWKGGCIIRAVFLDRISRAYQTNPSLPSLLVDKDFAAELVARQGAWRRVVSLGVTRGIALPAMSASLAYFDSYRRSSLPANLVQAQRDLFGAHTYERTDRPGAFHSDWSKNN